MSHLNFSTYEMDVIVEKGSLGLHIEEHTRKKKTWPVFDIS